MNPLPKFDENGNLSGGLQKTNIDEVVAWFSGEHNLVRNSRTQSLIEFYKFLKPFAIAIYIDGSYITTKLEPGDVDVAVLLPRGFDLKSPDGIRLHDYENSKKFSHLEIFSYIEGKHTERLNERVKGWMTDREYNPKGILYLEINK